LPLDSVADGVVWEVDVAWICLVLTAWGVVAPGDALPPCALTDAHGAPASRSADCRWAALAMDRKAGVVAKRWLADKPAGYLAARRIDFIVEISDMSPRFAQNSALPRLRKYRFRVLVANDAAWRARIPHERGKLTLLAFDESGVVTEVRLVDDPDAVDALVR